LIPFRETKAAFECDLNDHTSCPEPSRIALDERPKVSIERSVLAV